jgi:hypothetical protein
VLDAAQAGATLDKDVLRGCKRVVVIGVHGWFPGMLIAFCMYSPSFADTEAAELRCRDAYCHRRSKCLAAISDSYCVLMELRRSQREQVASLRI